MLHIQESLNTDKFPEIIEFLQPILTRVDRERS